MLPIVEMPFPSSMLLKEVQPFALYHSARRRRQAKAFLDEVARNFVLRDRISVANNDDDVVRIANEFGFSVSTADIWLFQDRDFKRKVGIRGWYSS